MKEAKHTQRIKHHFAHLQNGRCFQELWVLACHWMTCLKDDHVYLIAHTLCLIHASVLFRRSAFFQVEWLSFQFSPGKRCSQCNGTLHLGHQHPNGILKNDLRVGCHVVCDSLLFGGNIRRTKMIDSLGGLGTMVGWNIKSDSFVFRVAVCLFVRKCM